MNKNRSMDSNRKQNNGAFLYFICGFLVCFVIMAGIYYIYHHFLRSNTSSLIGGWVLSTEDISEEWDNKPKSFGFHGDSVDIVTISGNEVSCKYTVSAEALNQTIMIYDFYGKDIELHYSIQPLLHLYGVDDVEDVWKVDYLYAG